MRISPVHVVFLNTDLLALNMLYKIYVLSYAFILCLFYMYILYKDDETMYDIFVDRSTAIGRPIYFHKIYQN